MQLASQMSKRRFGEVTGGAQGHFPVQNLRRLGQCSITTQIMKLIILFNHSLENKLHFQLLADINTSLNFVKGKNFVVFTVKLLTPRNQTPILTNSIIRFGRVKELLHQLYIQTETTGAPISKMLKQEKERKNLYWFSRGSMMYKMTQHAPSETRLHRYFSTLTSGPFHTF